MLCSAPVGWESTDTPRRPGRSHQLQTWLQGRLFGNSPHIMLPSPFLTSCIYPDRATPIYDREQLLLLPPLIHRGKGGQVDSRHCGASLRKLPYNLKVHSWTSSTSARVRQPSRRHPRQVHRLRGRLQVRQLRRQGQPDPPADFAAGRQLVHRPGASWAASGNTAGPPAGSTEATLATSSTFRSAARRSSSSRSRRSAPATARAL